MTTAAAALGATARASEPPSAPSKRFAPWIGSGGRAILGVPLAVKIAGANAVILATVLAVAVLQGWPSPAESIVLVGALVVSLAVNAALVILALQPLRELERTADRVLAGDAHARIRVSALADAELRRVSLLLNHLLDALMQDRERIRQIGAHVMSTQDEERAGIARALEDSTAQGLAAVMYELRGALDRDPGAHIAAQLERVSEMTAHTLEQLRTITHTVYPRVLTDLGLMPTLDWLARTRSQQHRIKVLVRGPRPAPAIRPALAAALYRVAQEALMNAIVHGRATRVEMTLTFEDGSVTLGVGDNGRGFSAEPVSSGRGLTSIRAQMALVGGTLQVLSQPGEGTLIKATAPLGDKD